MRKILKLAEAPTPTATPGLIPPIEDIFACLFPRLTGDFTPRITTKDPIPRITCLKEIGEAKELLTLNIDYDSTNGCAPDAPITFSGNYTVKGEGVEGINIYVANEDTSDVFGPAITTSEGAYHIDANSPDIAGTYRYRAYTEDQLP